MNLCVIGDACLAQKMNLLHGNYCKSLQLKIISINEFTTSFPKDGTKNYNFKGPIFGNSERDLVFVLFHLSWRPRSHQIIINNNIIPFQKLLKIIVLIWEKFKKNPCDFRVLQNKE